MTLFVHLISGKMFILQNVTSAVLTGIALDVETRSGRMTIPRERVDYYTDLEDIR